MGSITRSFANNILTAGKFDGTKLTGDIPQANLTANAPAFDDDKIVNDISTLALREATTANRAASNTNSQYVDVFQDSTGIASHTTSARNTNEYVSSITQSVGSNAFEDETTNRNSTYTLTDTYASNSFLYSSSGPLSKMLDGSGASRSNSSGGSDYYLHGDGYTGVKGTHYMRWDRGAGNEVAFTGFKWWNQNNSTQYGGTDAWLIQGSNDNTNWTDLTNFSWTFNSADAPSSITWSNTVAYRSIQITPSTTLATSQANWQRQYVWGISPVTGSVNATGNFISNIVTASATTKMGCVITYQDQAGTNALNTDIVLQLSADNGSNFSTATLTALPDFSSGIKMAKVNDLPVTSGTQLKYKISFANQSGSKEARIRGVSLNY